MLSEYIKMHDVVDMENQALIDHFFGRPITKSTLKYSLKEH
jgi:hypothetical protein